MNRATRRALARNKRRPAHAQPIVNPTAWAATIARSRETDPGVALDISLKLRDAFEQLRAGSGTDEHFDRLASAINAGLVRAECIDPLLERTILDGRDALLTCDRIRGRHGQYGFTGPGLTAMDAALEAYDAIVGASTPAQMQGAIEEAIRRMRRGEIAA